MTKALKSPHKTTHEAGKTAPAVVVKMTIALKSPHKVETETNKQTRTSLVKAS